MTEKLAKKDITSIASMFWDSIGDNQADGNLPYLDREKYYGKNI